MRADRPSREVERAFEGVQGEVQRLLDVIFSAPRMPASDFAALDAGLVAIVDVFRCRHAAAVCDRVEAFRHALTAFEAAMDLWAAEASPEGNSHG